MASPDETIDDKDVPLLTSDRALLLETMPEEVYAHLDQNDATHSAKTVPLGDIKKRFMQQTAGDSGPTSTQIPQFAEADIYQKLSMLNELERAGGQRYAIGELLGSGGNGVVYDLRDNNFDRHVAVKLLAEVQPDNPKEVLHFLHEAFIASQLDHPNILPVYDLDVTKDGSPFYTMKKVEGYSLSQAIEDVVPPPLTNEVRGIDDIVRVFIKVCEAVAYAHDKGIIHQDIKPSNVMLGAFGEVRVVDWGSAIDTKTEEATAGRLVGTPVYMSPEQARREGADERSDVYCIAASLLHALTGRFPMWHESTRVFWKYKREGIIDPLSKADEERIPGPLIAIVYKALDPDPDDRYQSVAAMAADLMHYQSGLAVSAYHYSLWEFLQQWLHRNREVVIASSLAVLVLIAAVVYAYVQYQKELSGWGKPIVSETFDDDSWRQRWVSTLGTWQVDQGRLVTDSGPAFYAFLHKPVYGSVAIEFEGEMLPGSSACDLSIAYAKNIRQEASGIYAMDEVYLLQHGGFNNSCSMIAGPDGRLDYRDIQLEHGRRYHVRAEIDGNSMSLYLDGARVCYHRADFPWTSGYIGIYGYFKGKAFDNIKIYEKSVAEKVSVIETADVFFQSELYDEAIQQYQRIVASHTGTAIAEEALYKQGLCYFVNGDYEHANQLWQKLRTDTYAVSVRLHKWRHLLSRDEFQLVIDEMVTVYAQASQHEQSRIRLLWGEAVHQQSQYNKLTALQAYLSFWEQSFADDSIVAIYALRALAAVGAYGKIRQHLFQQPMCAVRYLSQRGEFSEVLENYSDLRHPCVSALFAMADYERIVKEFADIPLECAEAHFMMGQIEQAKQRFPDHDPVQARALLFERRFDELRKRYPEFGWGAKRAAYYTGKSEEYFSYPDEFGYAVRYDYEMHATNALRELARGNTDQAMAFLKQSGQAPLNYSEEWRSNLFAQFFFYQVLVALQGDHKPLQASLDRWQETPYLMRQRLYYVSELLAGHMDLAQFKQQPDQEYLEARSLFWSGLAADLNGAHTAALAQYEGFQALPLYAHDDSLLKRVFVQWRLNVLQK